MIQNRPLFARVILKSLLWGFLFFMNASSVWSQGTSSSVRDNQEAGQTGTTVSSNTLASYSGTSLQSTPKRAPLPVYTVEDAFTGRQVQAVIEEMNQLQAYDPLKAPPSEESDRGKKAANTAKSQPVPSPTLDPEYRRQQAFEKNIKTIEGLNQQRDQEIQKKYTAFSKNQRKNLPQKGKHMDFTAFNRQFRPIARRVASSSTTTAQP